MSQNTIVVRYEGDALELLIDHGTKLKLADLQMVKNMPFLVATAFSAQANNFSLEDSG